MFASIRAKRASAAMVLAVALLPMILLVLWTPPAMADGMPETAESSVSASPDASGAKRPAPERRAGRRAPAPSAQGSPSVRVAVRDPLAVDAEIAVKDTPVKAVDLPGVMKLDGADADMLDPSRIRKVFWRRQGIQSVWVSATQPNLIQVPFLNPRVVSTQRVQIDKSGQSNNIFVQYAETPKPEQLWIMPAGPSSDVVGLQLLPKDIPAQYIVVVDDAVQSTSNRQQRAGADNEYLTRVQALMEVAALGATPAGFAQIALQLPALAVNGLAIEGLRRLSSTVEDLYVYQVTNPGPRDREVREQEFDGQDVLAVSLLPKPLLRPGEQAVLVILARKRQAQ